MYRNVILEFLSANIQTMKSTNVIQMTLVLFPKEPSGISKLDYNLDEVNIYHIKNQYTFEKKYSFANIEGTIVEMMLEYKEKLTMNYDEFSFDIKDPYYLKDIKEQTFTRLEMIPVMDKNDLVGVSLVYFDDSNDTKLNITPKKWLTFFNKLFNVRDEIILDDILNEILLNENYGIIVRSLVTNQYYLNKNIRTYLKINSDILDKKDEKINVVNKMIRQMKKTTFKDYEVYYLSCDSLSTQNLSIELYLQDSLNSHGYQNEWSIIFTKDLEEAKSSLEVAEKMQKALNNVVPVANYKFYQITSGTIAILVDKAFSKKEQNDLKYQLKKHYYVLINVPKDISEGVDLIKLTNYLNDNLLDDFDYKVYKEYQNNLNIEKFECLKKTSNTNRILIKADTLETIGEVVSGPLANYYNLATYKLYEEELINTLEKLLKSSCKSPIITLLISSVSRRKILELLKKIVAKFSEPKIIFHAPVILEKTPKEVFETIQKIKEMGFIVIVDSTIFMNLSYTLALKIADALIIRKSESKESLATSNPYNQKLFEAFYEGEKVVIFEEIPQEKDASLINELTCLMIEGD